MLRSNGVGISSGKPAFDADQAAIVSVLVTKPTLISRFSGLGQRKMNLETLPHEINPKIDIRDDRSRGFD
jgi:hypothetical protein